MIKRLVLAVVAVVAMTTASAVPANASCAGTAGAKFWSHQICMAVGDTTIEAPYLAQQWNVQGGMAIQAANNCVTAGYPASRRFTIETFYEVSNVYWKVRNPNGTQLSPGNGWDAANGWWRYTNNPVLWVNIHHLADSTRRHNVSAAIGNLLGLAVFNSSGYNSRVMNLTAWSQLNVPTADAISGDIAESIYNGDCDIS